MNQTIDIANKLGANFSSGDPQVDAAAQEGKPSADAFGNKGQDGQYGQQGQYGAVTGQGFGAGAGLAKDAQGQSLAAGQGQPTAGRKHRDSAYEGMEHGDSTSTGGYGKNAQGSSFSRSNQMGADKSAAVFDDEDNEGRKTGYSTPGYLKEGEDPEAAERRNNLNVYGNQANDSGAVNHDEPNN